MKIKKNDTVQVITGKDAGKIGKVIKADPKNNTVIVEGVNIQTHHKKAQNQQPAEIIKIEGPIDASNVMYYDTKAKQASRIGYVVENGKKKRVAKKTGAVID
jgi:large subunit ribosomal protein L24